MARRVVTPLSEKTIKAKIRQFEQSGKKKEKVPDGNCLYLYLERSKDGLRTNTRWIVIHKGKEFGLGTYQTVSLSEARQSRNELLDKLKAGIDPKEERRREREERAQAALEERRKATLFSEVAERYIRENEAAWSLKNPMRAGKDRGLVKNHIAPVFDVKPVGEIDFNDAVRLVQSIADKGLSRSLVRKCVDLCKSVFIQAQGDGLRDAAAPFPFDMSGPYSVKAAPILESMDKEEHFPALAPKDAPAFFADLCRREPSVGRDALIFAMLTTLRINAVTGAKWGAVNWDEPKLEVPTGAGSGTRKIKDGKPYDSYLSSYAVKFLKHLSDGAFSPYIFTSDGNGPITREAVRNVIKRMNNDRRAEGLKEWRDYEMPLNAKGEYPEVVTHGVSRATFKTWTEEDSHGNNERFNPTAVELVMDHSADKAKGGRVQAAYNRSKYKNGRLEVVEAWGRYLVTGKYPDEPDGAPCEGWKKIVGAE